MMGTVVVDEVIMDITGITLIDGVILIKAAAIERFAGTFDAHGRYIIYGSDGIEVGSGPGDPDNPSLVVVRIDDTVRMTVRWDPHVETTKSTYKETR